MEMETPNKDSLENMNTLQDKHNDRLKKLKELHLKRVSFRVKNLR